MKGAATFRQQHVAEEIIKKLREAKVWQAKRFKEAAQRNFEARSYDTRDVSFTSASPCPKKHPNFALALKLPQIGRKSRNPIGECRHELL
jgi:hypothetical protein